MKVGDRAFLEYRLANTHYWPGTITEVTPGQRLATIELDEQPSILTTKTCRVETKHGFEESGSSDNVTTYHRQ